MIVLILNSGSSNCKLALFELSNPKLTHPQESLWNATIDWKNQGPSQRKNSVLKTLQTMPVPFSAINAVGHRIVHGGKNFQGPVVITSKVLKTLQDTIPLAPLHNPQSIEGIEIIKKLLPNLPQIAMFDTSFHNTLSDTASTYPGPYDWIKLGIKRYGFHGISYEYCSAKCSALLKKKNLKIVCCHLGNGASIAAIDSNKSVDTTMGFTPLEGLMMGTRSGSIDPGIIFYLEQDKKQSGKKLFDILNHSSGLLGISGKTSDMREIIKLCSQDNSRAILSFDMYVHSLRKNIGAMVAVLNGVDALVFTAGIGENSPLVRQRACEGLKHLGIILDQKRNLKCKSDELISSPKSPVKILVIKTQEDWCIACTISKMRSHGTI